MTPEESPSAGSGQQTAGDPQRFEASRERPQLLRDLLWEAVPLSRRKPAEINSVAEKAIELRSRDNTGYVPVLEPKLERTRSEVRSTHLGWTGACVKEGAERVEDARVPDRDAAVVATDPQTSRPELLRRRVRRDDQDRDDAETQDDKFRSHSRSTPTARKRFP